MVVSLLLVLGIGLDVGEVQDGFGMDAVIAMIAFASGGKSRWGIGVLRGPCVGAAGIGLLATAAAAATQGCKLAGMWWEVQRIGGGNWLRGEEIVKVENCGN